MIEKEIKEKTVQWIILEKEVLKKVLEKIGDKEITHAEWAEFFVGAVKEYGDVGMINHLKVYVDYLKSIKPFIKFANNSNNIDEMSEELKKLK